MIMRYAITIVDRVETALIKEKLGHFVVVVVVPLVFCVETALIKEKLGHW